MVSFEKEKTLRKLKLYIETSVWNFYFADDAPEKMEVTKEFFDLVHKGTYDIYISKVVVDEIREIMADQFTVADKIEAILFRLENEERFPFSALFKDMATRGEIACTFLALLELIKLRQLRAIQETAFGEILLIRAVE